MHFSQMSVIAAADATSHISVAEVQEIELGAYKAPGSIIMVHYLKS
jgi:hypothetical protein